MESYFLKHAIYMVTSIQTEYKQLPNQQETVPMRMLTLCTSNFLHCVPALTCSYVCEICKVICFVSCFGVKSCYTLEMNEIRLRQINSIRTQRRWYIGVWFCIFLYENILNFNLILKVKMVFKDNNVQFYTSHLFSFFCFAAKHNCL